LHVVSSTSNGDAVLLAAQQRRPLHEMLPSRLRASCFAHKLLLRGCCGCSLCSGLPLLRASFNEEIASAPRHASASRRALLGLLTRRGTSGMHDVHSSR
jgi:hypothetical protein